MNFFSFIRIWKIDRSSTRLHSDKSSDERKDQRRRKHREDMEQGDRDPQQNRARSPHPQHLYARLCFG